MLEWWLSERLLEPALGLRALAGPSIGRSEVTLDLCVSPERACGRF